MDDEITENDLLFSTFSRVIDGIEFFVWSDGDLEVLNGETIIPIATLEKILNISKEFIRLREL